MNPTKEIMGYFMHLTAYCSLKICEDENAFHLSQTISFQASVAITANVF